ncbi:cobalt-zinc-cadmium efflux system protein [Catalinimonas alkaloidigena]|uniref:Cobalt-zinc-cadmium efflux system protein n=1 Tax=Catalinimonas alkaloidigena TaxID=1075417 RepID=A0A1G9APL9_9BACT|nr:cation diffusion facilitator family transporter [Catalinimonas alkaloidigena]SDK28530.1 cobalt-zinc-cadmium efflux system protein [Catalinimonas alkaloidigena]
MSHSHAHGHHHHGHGHQHGPHEQSESNLRLAFFLNLGFTLFELVGGLYTNSVAILSDALHDLGDCVSLGLSWYLQRVSKRGRDATFSYGYRRFSLLGAVIISLVLVVGSVIILFEAIPRLLNPEPPKAGGMIVLAIVGVLVNGAAVFRLSKGESLNERAVKLHLLEDVLGWLAVLAGSILMYFFDLPILDPLLSVGIALFILFNVYRNLRDSFRIFLQATPTNVDIDALREQIQNVESVQEVHDIHAWSLDGAYNILTVHLKVNDATTFEESVQIRNRVKQLLKDADLQHVTVEVEKESETCDLQHC